MKIHIRLAQTITLTYLKTIRTCCFAWLDISLLFMMYLLLKKPMKRWIISCRSFQRQRIETKLPKPRKPSLMRQFYRQRIGKKLAKPWKPSMMRSYRRQRIGKKLPRHQKPSLKRPFYRQRMLCLTWHKFIIHDVPSVKKAYEALNHKL